MPPSNSVPKNTQPQEQILPSVLVLGSVLAAQVLDAFVIVVATLLLVVLAMCFKRLRNTLILTAVLCAGHLIWLSTSPIISRVIETGDGSGYLAQTLGRFGLFGYVLLFLVWARISQPRPRLQIVGDWNNTLKMPGVWLGRTETVSRFLFIYGLISLATFVAAGAIYAPSPTVVGLGLVFALVNSVLEEYIWRGGVLQQLTQTMSVPISLIVSSLMFGLYHLSLGFPLWACLIYAIGGFYMGAVTIVSGGLLPAVLMHICANMVMSTTGVLLVAQP